MVVKTGIAKSKRPVIYVSVSVVTITGRTALSWVTCKAPICVEVMPESWSVVRASILATLRALIWVVVIEPSCVEVRPENCVVNMASSCNTDYIVQVEGGHYLAPLERIDPAELINHCCLPTCGLRGQITLVALRAIQPAEEITFDYAPPIPVRFSNSTALASKSPTAPASAPTIGSAATFMLPIADIFLPIYSGASTSKHKRLSPALSPAAVETPSPRGIGAYPC